jgi:hypothetical protein
LSFLRRRLCSLTPFLFRLAGSALSSASCIHGSCHTLTSATESRDILIDQLAAFALEGGVFLACRAANKLLRA